jgi:hypothetical protein
MVHPECVMIGVDNGDVGLGLLVDDGETVFMVDYGADLATMQGLAKRCDFVWIDHHATSIDAANKAQFSPQGLREVGRAGCELTWEYFFGKSRSLPIGVFWLGRFDVWKWGGVEHAQDFQYGMQRFPASPVDHFFWEPIFRDDKDWLMEVVRDGQAIRAYQDRMDQEATRTYSFEGEFEGLRCLFLNTPRKGSAMFISFDPKKHDAMVRFVWNGSAWDVSMYSVGNVDVSAVCKKYGGGGHTNASGFKSKEVPFL